MSLPTNRTTLATDNFQRADQNPLDAPGWTAMANDPDNDWIPNQIISDQVFPTDVDLDAFSIYTATPFPDDQWGAVTAGSTFSPGNAAEIGVELRAQGVGSEMDYEVTIANQIDDAPFTWQIFVTTGGFNFAELASGLGPIIGGIGVSVMPGDVVYGQAVGNVISVYWNGQLMGSATDDTYASGSVGLLQGAVDGGIGIMASSISYWEGGAVGPITPTKTTGTLPFSKRTCSLVTTFAAMQAARNAQKLTSIPTTLAALNIEHAQLFHAYRKLRHQDTANQAVTLDAAILLAANAINALNATVQAMVQPMVPFVPVHPWDTARGKIPPPSENVFAIEAIQILVARAVAMMTAVQAAE